MQNNYREILKQYLSEKQRINPRYSLRSMARQVGIAPSTLSSVMSGERDLSAQKANAVAKKMGMSERDTDLFLSLIDFEKAKDLGLKERFQERIKKNHPEVETNDLSIEHFKIISDWYHFALMELTQTEEAPRHIRQMASSLGITELEAKLGVERLIRVGLMEKDHEGVFRKKKGVVQVASQEKNLGLRTFHTQTLTKAIKSLEEQVPQERFIGSETFAFDPEQLKEATEILEVAFKKILALANRGKKKKLYHLGIQMFKLNK